MASTAVAKRTSSGRVTPKKVRGGNNHVDVDAILAEKGLTPRAVDDIPTFTMTVFGEEFTILKAVNVLSLVMVDEDDPDSTARSVRSIINLIHPDDERRFRDTYSRQRDLSGAALNEVVAAMLRGAADPNPSSSRSGSGSTAKPVTSKELSAEN